MLGVLFASAAAAAPLRWHKLGNGVCRAPVIRRLGSNSTVADLIDACGSDRKCEAFSTGGDLFGAGCDVSATWHHRSPHTLYIRDTSSASSIVAATNCPVWPVPQSCTVAASATVTVTAMGGITCNAVPQSSFIDVACSRFVAETMGDHRATVTVGAITGVVLHIVNANAELQAGVDESYRMEVPTSGVVMIHAQTQFGGRHALESLSQLVSFDFDTGTYMVPTATIVDKPRFTHRGVLIDTARHYEPLATIRRVLHGLAASKMNVMHWHIVDDQSFPLQIDPVASIGMQGSYSPQERYTQNDVQDVVAYANSLGVRVMVEFDMPGHASSWCAGSPSICPRADCKTPLNPATNATFDVVAQLLGAVTKGGRGSGLFPDNFLHLGGDEVNTKCWTTTPSIQAWLTQMNFTPDQAYMYFVQRVQAIAHAQGRDVVGWEEIWRHFGTKLAPSTVIHLWLSGGTTARDVTDAGYRMLYSDYHTWYLDYLESMWSTMYDTEPCADITNATACDTLVLGGETCMWGETVDTSDIEQTIWPRAGAVAERLWGPRGTKSADAEARFAAFRCHLNRRGIAAAPYKEIGRKAPPGPGGCYHQ